MEDLQALKAKAINGSLWGILEKFSLQIVQFIVGVILARLLGPKDFGLIAITLIFTGIIQAITDAGFEKTLIFQKEIRSIQISTIFYVNILLGVLMTIILFITAPYIAIFFKDQMLGSILRVVSIGIIVSALAQTQRTLLMRDLKFKKLSYTQILSSLMAGITGVVFAYNGFGVWSLVYSGLISQFVSMLSFWIKSAWYPKIEFSYKSINGMIPYGGKILLASILYYFNMQFNNMVVGRNNNKEELGLFNRGSKLPELVTSTIQGIIGKMAFPVFSKLQDNNKQLTNVLKKTLSVTAFFLFPFLIMMFTCSKNLTILLFTEKWSGSIVFLEYFCIIRLFDPFISIYREAILAKGNAGLLFKILLFVSIFNAILILVLIKFGLIYLLMGTLASIIFQYVIYMYFFSVQLQVKITEQIGWLMPHFIIFIITTLLVKLQNYFLINLHLSLLVDLICKIVSIVFIYTFLSIQFKLNEVKLVVETTIKLKKMAMGFLKLKMVVN